MLWPKTTNRHRGETTTQSTQKTPNQRTKTKGTRKLRNREKKEDGQRESSLEQSGHGNTITNVNGSGARDVTGYWM